MFLSKRLDSLLQFFVGVRIIFSHRRSCGTRIWYTVCVCDFASVAVCIQWQYQPTADATEKHTSYGRWRSDGSPYTSSWMTAVLPSSLSPSSGPGYGLEKREDQILEQKVWMILLLLFNQLPFSSVQEKKNVYVWIYVWLWSHDSTTVLCMKESERRKKGNIFWIQVHKNVFVNWRSLKKDAVVLRVWVVSTASTV